MAITVKQALSIGGLQRRLTDLILSGDGLSAVVDALHDLIDRPVALVNGLGDDIASAALEDIDRAGSSRSDLFAGKFPSARPGSRWDEETGTSGVVDMLRVNMILKDDEKLLVVSAVPRLSDWQMVRQDDLAVTHYSLSHTDARQNATRVRVREASMPGFTHSILAPGGPMAVDDNQVATDCLRFANLHEDFVQPDVDLIVDGRPLLAKGQWV